MATEPTPPPRGAEPDYSVQKTLPPEPIQPGSPLHDLVEWAKAEGVYTSTSLTAPERTHESANQRQCRIEADRLLRAIGGGCRCQSGGDCACGHEQRIQRVMAFRAAAYTEGQPRWHPFPAEEPPRPPRPGQIEGYLVTTREGIVLDAYWSHDGAWWHGSISCVDVVAWMPYPEPAPAPPQSGADDQRTSGERAASDGKPHALVVAYLRAAHVADWTQVALNGGPPCFRLEDDGHFCLRAERWAGHGVHHDYMSFAQLVNAVQALSVAATPPRREGER